MPKEALLMKTHHTELIGTLRSIERELELAGARLDYTTDSLLIDSIIFEMASLYKRHAYYLGLCKELNVTASDGCAV